MVRLAVKLLLLDAADRVLLIHARDPMSAVECWYPVGGGVEPGESLQEAASREAYEETGLTDLPPGHHVWRRDHIYEYAGRTVAVHEEWLLHRVVHFEPVPTRLSNHETRSLVGFRWWRGQELAESTDVIFPPRLGYLVLDLLASGTPATPVDISDPAAASRVSGG